MKKLLTIILICVCSLCAFTQNTSVTGFVFDAQSGECVIGANVFLADHSRGTATDTKGHFGISLTLPATICLSYIGYADTTFTLYSQPEKPLTITLRPITEMLQTVEVSATKMEMERPRFNTITLTAKTIESLPTLGSRPDIIKAAQLMPGIEPFSEGSSIMLVRGGNPGENQYILDNVPLIYVNHLGGFMSVFNSEMINSMDIYKGGFPARFGGKLSSIVNLTGKKGDVSQLKGSLDIGLTDMAFSVEGPGGLKNSSFIVTGRKTFFEALLYGVSEIAKLAEAQDNNIIYGFHDFDAKYTWSPNSKNVFSLNVYEGDDYLCVWKNSNNKNRKEKARIGNVWGNLLVAGQWDRTVGTRVFATNTLSYTRYRLRQNNKVFIRDGGDTLVDIHQIGKSTVQDVSIRSDWKLTAGKVWSLEYGLQSSFLSYAPNNVINKKEGNNSPRDRDVTHVFDNAVYLDNKFTFGKVADGSIGLRVGFYANKELKHFSFEPRFNFNFHIRRSTINISAMSVTQNQHLLLTPGSILNSEIWIPADSSFLPSRSDQASIGWQRGFLGDRLRVEANAYYKIMRNLTTYREGYVTMLGDGNWRNKVTSGGKGESYGVELAIKADFGNISGMAAYTYSHTTRQFEEINNGEPYLFEYDRPHSVNLNVNYDLNPRWSFSASWVYQTGMPFTPIVGIQYTPIMDDDGEMELVQTNIYGKRNSDRMRDYHRLDIAAKLKTLTRKGRRAEWTFSIYNVYCRQNPYYYYYGDKKGNPLSWGEYPDDPQSLWQRSFFPIIPSFSYKIWF